MTLSTTVPPARTPAPVPRQTAGQPPDHAIDDRLDHGLILDAGGQRWAVPADSVREVHAVLAVQPVAGTASWFLGTAVSRGRVVAVSDFGAWLGCGAPVERYVEFNAGYVLGVSGVQPGESSSSGARLLDPQRLLALAAFVDITGEGGSPALATAS